MKEDVRRREWIANNADPTRVVEWVIQLPNGKIITTEFQGAYAGFHVIQTEQLNVTSWVEAAIDSKVTEQIHKALEAQWEEKQG